MGYYQRLKDLKEDADLTQKQVADLIGVSTNHYGKYERGETDLPLEKAVILANYYNCSLDYLAGRTIYRHGCANPEFTDDELTLIEQYRLLNERSRGRHDILLKQLLEQQAAETRKTKKTI